MFDLGPGVVNIAFLFTFAYCAGCFIQALVSIEENRSYNKRKEEEERTLQAIETTKQVEIAHTRIVPTPRAMPALVSSNATPLKAAS